MDFDERLQRAIQRGQGRRTASAEQAAAAALSEEESRALHVRLWAELSDHLEAGLRRMVDSFPGFEFQTVLDEGSSGAKITRDDLVSQSGRGFSHSYSHLQVVIRVYTPRRLLEIVCRGTIANKEVMQRSFFQRLDALDLDLFKSQMDQWLLEYAERFAEL